MGNQFPSSDISKKDVVVIYKHSRYSYIQDRGTQAEKLILLQHEDPMSKDLLRAHEENLAAIASILETLNALKINHHVVCRADIKKSDLVDKFIVAIGGDGTLLDCSHYCEDSAILGVNSDPNSSIGALCAANVANFALVFNEILSGKLKPTPLTRLRVAINGRKIDPLALNDILFCHKNPASLSRFTLELNDIKEAHRGSGIWIATAAGSTGGIYSSGATPLPIENQSALFRQREPYWSDSLSPQLLSGVLSPNEKLTITCNMTDGEIYIDGPHERHDIAWSDTIEIYCDKPELQLYDGPRLNHNREKIIERRKAIHSFLG